MSNAKGSARTPVCRNVEPLAPALPGTRPPDHNIGSSTRRPQARHELDMASSACTSDTSNSACRWPIQLLAWEMPPLGQVRQSIAAVANGVGFRNSRNHVNETSLFRAGFPLAARLRHSLACRSGRAGGDCQQIESNQRADHGPAAKDCAGTGGEVAQWRQDHRLDVSAWSA